MTEESLRSEETQGRGRESQRCQWLGRHHSLEAATVFYGGHPF